MDFTKQITVTVEVEVQIKILSMKNILNKFCAFLGDVFRQQSIAGFAMKIAKCAMMI